MTFCDFVKSEIKFKSQLYNTYIKNGYKENDYNMLQEAINEVSKIISKRKEEYHYQLASKLSAYLMQEVLFWICRRILTKFGMKS